MATYLEIWELYQSGNLRTRAAVAVMKAAVDVLNEDPEAQNHARRLLWAEWALRNPEQAGQECMWFICSNASIQSNGEEALDGDIQFVVNSAVDVLAARFAA